MKLNLRAEQYLNNDLKKNLSRQGVPSNQSQLDNRGSNLMKLLEKRTWRICFLFQYHLSPLGRLVMAISVAEYRSKMA